MSIVIVCMMNAIFSLVGVLLSTFFNIIIYLPFWLSISFSLLISFWWSIGLTLSSIGVVESLEKECWVEPELWVRMYVNYVNVCWLCVLCLMVKCMLVGTVCLVVCIQNLCFSFPKYKIFLNYLMMDLNLYCKWTKELLSKPPQNQEVSSQVTRIQSKNGV
jgi:hypothetical protein